MATRSLPSTEYLNELFFLSEEDSVLYWKTRPLHHFVSEHAQKVWNTRFAGKKAGRVSEDGYIRVMLKGRNLRGHRVIHKLRTGEDYTGYLDHKNNNRSDNASDNLRKATHSQNKMNGTRAPGKSLYRGVFQRNATSYHAYIHVKGIKGKAYLGAWSTQEDAHSAFCLAAMHFHKEFANFGPNSCFPTFPLTSDFVKKARFHIEKAEQKLADRKSGSVNL